MNTYNLTLPFHDNRRTLKVTIESDPYDDSAELLGACHYTLSTPDTSRTGKGALRAFFPWRLSQQAVGGSEVVSALCGEDYLNGSEDLRRTHTARYLAEEVQHLDRGDEWEFSSADGLIALLAIFEDVDDAPGRVQIPETLELHVETTNAVWFFHDLAHSRSLAHCDDADPTERTVYFNPNDANEEASAHNKGALEALKHGIDPAEVLQCLTDAKFAREFQERFGGPFDPSPFFSQVEVSLKA